MSSADDVFEMRSITNELADALVGARAKLAARAGAVMDAIGGEVTDNRALEFLKGKARRVDAWEKENAKRQLAKVREQARVRREREHLQWLTAEIGRHRANGTEFHGVYSDALEHLARVVRGDAGAVETPTDGGTGE